jgi:hypothetical protein
MTNIPNFNDFINENVLNESSDIDVTKLSDGMLKEIRKVFNEVKHGLSNNDLQLLAKITMEIKKRGLKESVNENELNENAKKYGFDAFMNLNNLSIMQEIKKDKEASKELEVIMDSYNAWRKKYL